MATVRERICGAGVSTLRQFLCLDVGVGGGITYTGELNSISATKEVELIEVTTVNSLSEEPSINITQADIIVEIQSVKDGDINGVC